MKWKIETDGTVKQASVKSTTLKNDKVEKCMIEEVKLFKFPKPNGNGILKVIFPFVFKPI